MIINCQPPDWIQPAEPSNLVCDLIPKYTLNNNVRQKLFFIQKKIMALIMDRYSWWTVNSVESLAERHNTKSLDLNQAQKTTWPTMHLYSQWPVWRKSIFPIWKHGTSTPYQYPCIIFLSHWQKLMWFDFDTPAVRCRSTVYGPVLCTSPDWCSFVVLMDHLLMTTH